MKEKHTLFIINLFLFIILAVLLILILRSAGKPDIPAMGPKIAHKEAAVSQKAVYSIPEETSALGPVDTSAGTPASLNDVYARYPMQDAGDNMTAAWSLVNPEDKKRLIQAVDKNISETREVLKADPENKKLRKKLLISETMKKLISTDFNYKFREND